jgi:hypothetical protein
VLTVSLENVKTLQEEVTHPLLVLLLDKSRNRHVPAAPVTILGRMNAQVMMKVLGKLVSTQIPRKPRRKIHDRV